MTLPQDFFSISTLLPPFSRTAFLEKDLPTNIQIHGDYEPRFEPVADAQHPGGAERHREQQDHALEQGLPQRPQVEDEEEIVDGAQHDVSSAHAGDSVDTAPPVTVEHG